MNRILCLCHCKCSLVDHAQQSGVRDAEPDPRYGKLLHDDYLSFKEHEGSYTVRPRAVSLAAAANSGTRYAVEFQWPKKVPPGDYQVEVYACREHKVIARSGATLQLVEVGFPAYMANLASKFPWVYGAGAVLVAMLAGFLTDALTGRLRRRKRGLAAERGLPAPEKPGAAPEMAPADTHEAETIHRS